MSDLNITSLFNVKDKVAVVTGGGSGLGAMMATALVQNGAKVYIASRKESQLKEVSEALQKIRPGSCHYVVADLSSKAGCDKFTDAIKEKETKIHILINNSGATWGAPYDKFPEKEGWDRVMALNVKSIFYITQGLTEPLAKDSTSHDPGRVINISSVAGFSPIVEGSHVADRGTGLWSYHASKAAVNHLTSALASTLIRRYITVNAICPGVFPSKMTAHGYKTAKGEMVAAQPTGRLGEPSDIAGVALFLASPGSAHVTGAHIVVDGGSLIAPSVRARL
ncbi:putative NADPH-dependent beta-ketoacyl reductase [Gautieria morchelliformis]|nr:putative NADPH-dependent beta-ketoacyl reductase [Gautieria morchelliformis]